jgi:hypothetical protein
LNFFSELEYKKELFFSEKDLVKIVESNLNSDDTNSQRFKIIGVDREW